MLFNALIVFLLISLVQPQNEASSSTFDKQYASIPELFQQDNYDLCKMRGDEAFYCAITYQVEPLNETNPSETFSIIKNLSEVRTNYRHDLLRHWLCVPQSCPGVNISHDDDPVLREGLKKCYDEKYAAQGLKGSIAALECATNEYKYPFDWVDALALLFYTSYIGFVLFATFYEGWMRYKPAEEYEKCMTSKYGKYIAACSITRNWIRLKTINSTPEIEKLRPIQGIRVYNTALVVLTHTALSFVAPPISNPRYTETMHEKYATIFLSSGPLCVSTFFFISSFFLSNGLFEHMKKKKMNLKTVLFIFANRLFRLTPTLFVTVLFHATLLRHLGSGPVWDKLIVDEFKKCRKNGWTNVLYLNNWIDYTNMCLPVTWYLALDTQYFLLFLFFIWFLKSYEKHFRYIIGAALAINIVGTFIQNYRFDFTALVVPVPEMYYLMRNLFTSVQFHYQLGSFIGNTGAPLIGIAFGYYFCNHKYDKTPFFTGKARHALWWIISWGIGLGFVLIPGAIILQENTERDLFWASTYVAISRPLFSFAIGTGIYGLTEGVGWLCIHTLNWAPTYVLGRLSFTAYLIHMSVVMIRPSLARFPTYVSDYHIATATLGDLCMIYICALLLTLFLEMPLSEFQKFVFGQTDTKAVDKQENKKE